MRNKIRRATPAEKDEFAEGIAIRQMIDEITALYCRLSCHDEQDGLSGVTFTRPAFMEMMNLAEQGKIGTIIVKDHSRLGRNRLVVGQLLEEDFERLDVRYIAIMDNIDTAKGISDLVPMQDLFNEWHAKNTSQKVRNVLCNKGMAGFPLTSNPPYGYMKNPENPKEWGIDEPAARVVRQIFDMCVAGFGPTQIAKKLKAAEVMTPTEYWGSIGRNHSKLTSIPFNWHSSVAADILSRQEYIGNTAADQPDMGLSVCFRDFYTALTAAKNCITVRQEIIGGNRQTFSAQPIVIIPIYALHIISVKKL